MQTEEEEEQGISKARSDLIASTPSTEATRRNSLRAFTRVPSIINAGVIPSAAAVVVVVGRGSGQSVVVGVRGLHHSSSSKGSLGRVLLRGIGRVITSTALPHPVVVGVVCLVPHAEEEERGK